MSGWKAGAILANGGRPWIWNVMNDWSIRLRGPDSGRLSAGEAFASVLAPWR